MKEVNMEGVLSVFEEDDDIEEEQEDFSNLKI